MQDGYDPEASDPFEVTDIDPLRTGRHHASGQRGGPFRPLSPRQRLSRLLGMIGVGLLALAGLLLAAHDLAAPQSSVAPRLSQSAPATAIATYAPTPVSGLLAPPPLDCPLRPPPSAIHFPQGLSVPQWYYSGPVTFSGAAPVWLYNPPRIAHLNQAGLTAWPIEELKFVVGPQYTGSVIVSGGVFGTNEPLWFDTSGQVPPPSGAIFASATTYDLSGNNAQWTQISAFPFFGHAGCYYLDVRASATHWRIVFAVGR